MHRWQAVIFDLDDTLFPESAYVLSGFEAVARWAEGALGFPAEVVLDELRSLAGSGVRGDTFDRWLAQRGVDAERVGEMVQAYRSHVPRLQPFPEVLDLLATLRAEFQLGLVSDGYLDVQRAKFEALGLAGFFSAVVFSDELGRDAWKPSAAPFRRVLAQLGVPPAAAVYVGDNCTKDFIGARGAGLATIWARHSRGHYAAQMPASAAHAADYTIESLSDLPSVLARGPSALGAAP